MHNARCKMQKTAFDIAQAQPKKKCFNKMIKVFCWACLDEPGYAQNNIKRYAKAGYRLDELKVKRFRNAGPYKFDKMPKEPLLVIAGEDLTYALLKAGVPADVKDSEGQTPLQQVVNVITQNGHCNFSTIIPLLLQYEAAVTEDMVSSVATKDKDIHAMLLRAWKKQEENERLQCCICFEVSANNFLIPCANKHTDRICQKCCAGIQSCPTCRQLLKK